MIRRTTCALVLAIAVVGSGCNLFTSISDGDAGHSSMDATSDIPPLSDATGDTTVDEMGSPDTGLDAADAADADECTPETPVEFCRRQGKNCGVLSGVDNCGDPRDVDCGECTGDDVCGESENNVCGCPCLIDGECWIEGEANPDDPCLVCDPAQATDAFSIDVGASCDDGNPCSAESTCTDDGACEPTDFDGCESLTTECQVGICDEEAQECVVDPVPDDTGCSDDGLACTADVCSAGECTHPVMEGFCAVDGECVGDGEPNPNNPCEVCDTSASTTEFTPLATGSACPDGDGLSCTQGQCDDAGQCVATLDANSCAIGGTCYGDGDTSARSPCQVCDPAASTDQFTDLPDDTSCDDGDGLACTQGVCANGACAGRVQDGSCLIGGVCYSDGTTNPANACEVCDASASKSSWTALDGGSCPTSFACTTGVCSAGVCEDSLNPGQCLIDTTCYAAGTQNPDNQCELCDPTQSATTWTSAPDDMPCAATGNCTCQTGQCVKSNMDLCD